MSINLHSMGGRRFLLAVGCGAITSVLCWYGKISDVVYATVVLGTVGGFITGNVIESVKGKGDPHVAD